MTSGTYRYDPDLDSDRKWPAYFDGKAIWADWNNNRLFTVQINDGRRPAHRHQPVPAPSLPMQRPHALQFGPDGALYMIEWGSGFDGNNADSGIYRIDYVEGNRAPIAQGHDQPDVRSGAADGGSSTAPASFDPDTGDATGLTYAWDFTGDGTTDATEANPTLHLHHGGQLHGPADGDRRGRPHAARPTCDITAGNTAPTVDARRCRRTAGSSTSVTRSSTRSPSPTPRTARSTATTSSSSLASATTSTPTRYEQYTGCKGIVPAAR